MKYRNIDYRVVFELMHGFSRLDVHFATRCHFPSCQKVTNPSTCIFAVSAAFLSRAVNFFRPFLGFCFLDLATRFTGTLFVSFGFLALDCCARLPGGATERKEKILLCAMSWPTMASTSPCTVSSCASAGFAMQGSPSRSQRSIIHR